ncbi:MAG: hypothetical protein M3Y77_00670 [Actinomycetota bacterium]|nr:hypothetical protein [Actinomycetota bacterium]
MIRTATLLGGHAHFVQWGVVQISLANLIVIVLMLVVFALALVLRFPHSRDADGEVEIRHVER